MFSSEGLSQVTLQIIDKFGEYPSEEDIKIIIYDRWDHKSTLYNIDELNTLNWLWNIFLDHVNLQGFLLREDTVEIYLSLTMVRKLLL